MIRIDFKSRANSKMSVYTRIAVRSAHIKHYPDESFYATLFSPARWMHLLKRHDQRFRNLEIRSEQFVTSLHLPFAERLQWIEAFSFRPTTQPNGSA